jgi:hypothetical protein
MNITIPLTKIDVERRLIFGRAVQEVPDKSGEILDYATAKPAFQAWSKGFEDATGGLSKGNLRVMHKKDGVAGKLVDLTYNDGEKAIDICAKVVDDVEWAKCLEGVYTGLSVGGSYAHRWKDGEHTRYTPRVAEVSLVDSPCIPTCRIIDLVKADGMTGQLELRGRARTYAELAPPAPPPSYSALVKAAPRTYGEMEKGALGSGLRAARIAYDNGRALGASRAASAVGGAYHGVRGFKRAGGKIRSLAGAAVGAAAIGGGLLAWRRRRKSA